MTTAKAVAFFNNKGGVGKTTLVYHLAWKMAELGYRVVAADLDPQANLTTMFLDEERLELLWPDSDDHPETIFGGVLPIVKGTGDIRPTHLEGIVERLSLICGDIALSRFEARLSAAWPGCMDRDEAAFRTTTAFHRLLRNGAETVGADIILIDVGPNLGAVNRSALIAADFVVVPLAPDLFSVQGLRNLGPTLKDWRQEWSDRRERGGFTDLALPAGEMRPLGYVATQHAVRLDRPVKAYERWMQALPREYRRAMFGDAGATEVAGPDRHCLAELKHYRSLMPLAMEARKPMFALRAADGAMGAHQHAAIQSGRDFAVLARKVIDRINETGPSMVAQSA